MTAGASKAGPTITLQPALAPSPQPRPAPTARALIVRNVGRRGPFWMPIWGPDRTPIDTLVPRLPLCSACLSVDTRAGRRVVHGTAIAAAAPRHPFYSRRTFARGGITVPLELC